jgi:hypothetical protein
VLARIYFERLGPLTALNGEIHMFKKLLTRVFVGLLTGPIIAHAAIIAYTDRQTWAPAGGLVTGSENFNSFGSDTSFDGTSLALAAGMSIGSIGAVGTAFYNIVDVPPPETPEGDVNGTAHAFVAGGPFGSGGSVTPFISFSSPVHAFGADFRNLNDNLLRTTIDVYNGSTLLGSLNPSVLPVNNLRFFGFAASAGETVTQIRFRWNENDAYGIDNIEIAAVPEPATLALVGLTFAGLGFSRRKQ